MVAMLEGVGLEDCTFRYPRVSSTTTAPDEIEYDLIVATIVPSVRHCRAARMIEIY